MGTSKLQLRYALIEAPKFNFEGLVPRLILFVALLIGSQVLVTGAANSTTLLGGNVQAKITEGNTTLDSASDGSNTAAGHSVSVPQNGGPSVPANATSTIGFSFSPFASVSAAGGALLDGSGTIVNAGGNATLTYTFVVQGPAGPANSIPVGIDILISTSVSGVATAPTSITVSGADAFATIFRNNGDGFLGEILLNLTPGSTYEVDLSAGASAFGQSSASSLVDPHIFIDSPALALLYSIVLPDGVGNDLPPGFGGPTPTVPLPATLPLFATGLGALGLMGWRSKKKAALSLRDPKPN